MADIILAVIAVLLGIKLFSLFGQKRDVKRKNSSSSQCGGCCADPTAPLRENIKEVELKLENITDPAVRLKLLCPSFDMKKFLTEAKGAYKTILKFYAEGNTQALSDLINIEMMRKFAYEITQREEKGLTCRISLLKPREAVVEKVSFEDDTVAILRVAFKSEIINYTADKNHKIKAGHKTKVDNREDVWTFGRDLRDPNVAWKVVEVNQLF